MEPIIEEALLRLRNDIVRKQQHQLKQSFADFIGETLATVDPAAQYLPNWHIDLIAQHLQAAQAGEITRLIINMPPRSLKSVCVSVAWPAWLMGHDPSSRIIAASYAQSLSLKHSMDCRLVMESAWYKKLFPDVKLARDQNEKHKFMTTRRGMRFATSVGASAVGEGGNFLIIDDPISPMQAMNENWRSHVNQWFEHTFASRLDDKKKGVIVLVMQRLHAEDLSGHLLRKGGWEHLMLPAVATKREVFDMGTTPHIREVGDMLHSGRENDVQIARAKLELGSSAFAAQYQQNPQNDEGAMVRPWWFGRYKTAPMAFERIVQSWDTAIKAGQQHDASVCLTFGEEHNKSYLLDVRVLRREYPDLKRALYALAEQWQPQAILIEDRASGQQLLQDVRRETLLPVIACNPKHDKVTRFAAVSAMIEAGKIHLPESAPWLADFESEIFAFPTGAHDDQVDALTQYLDWLRASSFNKLRVRRI
jgi:predicted phage terminase large subunit-like protein